MPGRATPPQLTLDVYADPSGEGGILLYGCVEQFNAYMGIYSSVGDLNANLNLYPIHLCYSALWPRIKHKRN